MKIIVLHGDDTIKSYERLRKFIETAKERSWEVAYIDESNQNIQENLSTTSLFDSERFFILRDIKKLGKKELEWLNKKYAGLSGTLIIYHEGTIGVTILKGLPKDTKIEEFKLPKLIWNFLEHIYPGNSSKVIVEFHKIIETEAPEFVFTLIAKQFRDLYWVKTDVSSTGFPSWKLGKLKSQASKFDTELLKSLIGKLSDVDIKVKTGRADLVSSLDLMILKQLE